MHWRFSASKSSRNKKRNQNAVRVDLVFANSGWRRLGQVGKTQKTVDIELMLPTTGERAFVQVKSSASKQDLTQYVEGLPLFFVTLESGAIQLG